MAIDAQRLDEIIAEFTRQQDAVRARLATITQLPEIMHAVRAEFSKTSPDASRVRVFLMQRPSAGGPAAGPVPPSAALTDAEKEVVLARITELEAFTRDWQRIIANVTQRLLHPPGSPATPRPRADTALSRAEAEATTIRPDDPEALAWLRENSGDAPLAANRFDAADAREFVESLYRAGAPKVVIASECIRDDEDPPYADGMRVMLPDDAARRGAVLDLVNREMEEEGFDPEPDRGQQVVFLWWD